MFGRKSAPTTPDTPMVKGTVNKWVHAYGFVDVGDGGKEVFVHKSVLEPLGLKFLEEGQAVLVSIEEVEKGRQATKLELA